MATERTSRPMAEFYKFSKIGQAAVGRVTRAATNANGGLLEMSPVLLRADRKADWVRYGSVAIGLSTDIKYKLDADPAKEQGKILLIEFTDTEATKKGASKKIFRVLELSVAEFDKLHWTEGGEYHGDSDGGDLPTNEPEDDLPF